MYSEKLDRYYIGSTKEIHTRLKKHLQSRKGFTSKAKDWIVVYAEGFETRKEAIRRELQIKKWKSRRMIENLLHKK